MKQTITKFILLTYLISLLLTGCDNSESAFTSCELLAVAAGSEYCKEMSEK